MIRFVLVFCLSINCSFAGVFDSKIEQAINKVNPDLNIGIKITNLSKNKIVYARNSNRYYTPASILKFITTVNAYRYLGDDFNFVSSLYKSGNDFYIKMHDPDFSQGDLDIIAKEIIKSSNNKIGIIYIYQDNFSLPPISRGKTYSDTVYCYGAPITKVHYSKNCVKVQASPAKEGEKIAIKTNDDFPYKVNNQAVSVGKKKLDRLHINITDNDFNITGTLSRDYKKIPVAAVVHKNYKNLIAHLKKKLNILSGKKSIDIAVIKNIPDDAELVYESKKNIKDIISIALKKSDNFITDYLLAEIASPQENEWRGGVRILKNLSKKYWNVKLLKSAIHDGSGISRLNNISVNQFDSMLQAVAKSKYFQNITYMMSKPGDPGQMENRFKDSKIKLFAKTGSLNGVCSLIGYFYNNNNELHSFVIISNNFYGSHSKYRKLEEDIISIVAK